MSRFLQRARQARLVMSFSLITIGLTLGLVGGAVADVERHSLKLSDGTKVTYQVVTPSSFDPAREYPAILYFAGGPGNARIVKDSVQGNWGTGAEDGGYILIAPVVSGRKLFFRGGEEIFPEFLDKMLETYRVKDGKFHLFGISNGGISAMHVAALNPAYFKSVITMPGYLRDATPARYEALKDMCIAFVAGEKDTVWVRNARRDHSAFTEMGMSPFIDIVPNGGHVPNSYRGDNADKIFDLIAGKAGC